MMNKKVVKKAKVDKTKTKSSKISPKIIPQINTKKVNEPFPIVGIGASAGGLNAFKEFFSGMPQDEDPEMAFVLVQHLAPDHDSILTDLVQRFTKMQVFEVVDGMAIQKNCIYIIPPNYEMALINRTLQLLKMDLPRGHHLPIDYFFRSLAEDQKDHAIGIILSGTGSDGTLGLRSIKSEAGMVMVQEPSTCEFDGMPVSAIHTGLVDFQLPPAEMAAKLISYVNLSFKKVISVSGVENFEDSLKKIFVLLRSQVGHDFSQYKPSTINRRIERRMAVVQVDTLKNYVKYLHNKPEEVEALFRDLLIGVTSFFRDPEAFSILEENIIPTIVLDKKALGGVIRVWSTGCSTGEEAYSIAILLQERMQFLKESYTVQLFVTDIDNVAISTARAGIYPANIAADVSPERLKRFFTLEPDGNHYRINKSIRDMLIFSEQNVIKDPPFSKLDLIICRNLLIYFNSNLQEKLIPLFHYALNPNGILFLGASEGLGNFEEMFTVLDRKSKIYQRKETSLSLKRASLSRNFHPKYEDDLALPHLITKSSSSGKLPLREMTERALLQQIAPAGALVNKRGDIFYLHGRTGMYLEPSQGEVNGYNVINMAREGLRSSLVTALKKADTTKEVVRVLNLRVKTNGHFTLVNISVRPIQIEAEKKLESAHYLVIFEEGLEPLPVNTSVTHSRTGKNSKTTIESQIMLLELELKDKDQALLHSQQELQSSTEELKSSNEEMQSVNEELQSTNEELETSKEELQSLNEELATVNNELNNKVLDLSRINNDMNNLLAGTGIATIFVDHQLNILRFTPAAAQIINLIKSDVARPVGHLASNLVGYNSLTKDTQSVLDTLQPKELEVKTTAGMSFMMRIRPYRTMDNVIEGAVITFMDIADLTALKDKLVRMSTVILDSHDAITMQDLEGRIIAWNPAAVRIYGWTEDEALSMNVRQRIPPEIREDAIAKLVQLSKSKILEPYLTERITKNGKIVEVWVTATALINKAHQVYAIATTERLKVELLDE